MNYQEIQGDLFKSEAAVIAHGCNIKGVMGAGVAAIVRQKWPHCYSLYKRDCVNNKFNVGDCLIISKKSSGIGHSIEPAIANLATQENPGADARVGYIVESLIRLREIMVKTTLDSLAMPKIGCGIGGLHWDEVEPFIEPIFAETDINVTVYYL